MVRDFYRRIGFNLNWRCATGQPTPAEIKSSAASMNQAEAIAKSPSIFDTEFLEKTFGVRFRVGGVENAKNVGEFAGLILMRQQNP
jgi:hypothetical protein